MLARMIIEKVTFGQNPESVRELEIWLERSMQREHPVKCPNSEAKPTEFEAQPRGWCGCSGVTRRKSSRDKARGVRG